MTQSAFDTLPSLADALERFCQEGRSGALRIVTSDNHTAFFGLLAGRIVSVQYRIRKDVRALEQILGVSAGRYTFAEDAIVPTSAALLPDTGEILAMLRAENPNMPAPVRAVPAPEPTVEPAAEVLTSDTQALLLDTLTRYAGPAASLMGRGVFANASSVAEAIDKLAEKIPDQVQAHAFALEARGKLTHLL